MYRVKKVGTRQYSYTLNIYAHALKSKDRKAANTLERCLDTYAKIG